MVLTAMVMAPVRAASAGEPALASSATSLASASPSQPWDGPAFSAAPGALLKSAAAISVPGGAEVLMLLQEARYRFDAAGREAFELRRVFKVISSVGASNWGTASIGWSPWYQQAPKIRARVITSDGKPHDLDPKTIEVLAADQNDSQMLNDRRSMRAALPAMVAGAVVEELFTLQDQTPQLEGGLVDYQPVGLQGMRVERQRVMVSAPASVPLKTAVHLVPGLHAVEARHDGTVELTFDIGPMDPVEPAPPGLPTDQPAHPAIVFSTGASWAAVAAGYAKLVEPQRIADAALKALVRETLGAGATGKGGFVSAASAVGRDEIIAKLLDRVQRDVRYTGVELGEASIVPRAPAEVLARHYGDCKDKALLLVALLNEAGIAARLALLRATFETDVDPSLPGFGLFNHAIVFVPGPRPLWIDATARFTPVGTLPLGDQGRLALVIAPGTRALARTPSAGPEENRVIETREIRLPDVGKARVVETTELWGAPAERYRAGYADLDPKKIKEGLEKYARDTYQADTLQSHQLSDPYALAGAFRLQFEAANAGFAEVYDSGASILLPCGALLSRLPEDLRAAKDDAAPDKETKKRTADYWLDEPFVHEWRYRLIPPAGMAARQIPEGESIPLGPARLTKSFSRGADGTVQATFRFDTIKGRYTAAEAEAMRQAIGKLFKGDATVIRFEQLGVAHLEAGRVTAAIGEFRRLRDLDPKKAIHRARLARALLAAGQGEAARSEIRAAVALDPKWARAYAIEGWILQHDLLGRRFKPGCDLAGAEAAYRQAKAFDPGDSNARADLAILYEMSPAGEQRGPQARLAEAVTEWRALPDKELERFRDNLMLDLVTLERWADLRALARPWPSTPVRDAALLAALAAEKGAGAALTEAPRLVADSGPRVTALQTAAIYLMGRRRYPEAAALAAEASNGRGPEARALAELLSRTHRRETVKLTEPAPDAAARAFVVEGLMAVHERSIARLKPFFADERFGSGGPAEERAMLAGIEKGLDKKTLGIPLPVLADVVASLSEAVRNTYKRDGNDRIGYRYRQISAQAGGGTIFLARRAGAFKIVGMDNQLAALGQESLRALAAGDREAARHWIDWAFDLQPAPEDDPLSGGPLARLWSRSASADDRAIQIADAALTVIDDRSASALGVLERCRAAQRTEDEPLGCAAALAIGYMARKRFADALPVAEELARRLPQSAQAFELRMAALRGLARAPVMRALAEERLKKIPGDLPAQRWIARSAVTAGDVAAAEKALRAAVLLPEARAEDFNELAWAALFTGRKLVDADLEPARQAVNRSQRKLAFCLHTLATLDAELGHTDEATQLLLESLAARQADEPSPVDWYVVGRAAEQLGLPDAAVAAYRRVTATPSEAPQLATATLARRRLERLEARAPIGEGR
jgi:predicted Zn-dependent protease